MCVDLSHLNRYMKCKCYHSVTPAQAVADITAERAQIFTKMDAKKGYHQCPLDQESQDLTTFITPFGRFKFLRVPYGISSTSENYNRCMDEAFADHPGFRQVVDDILIYNQDREHHTEHVRQFLKRCEEKCEAKLRAILASRPCPCAIFPIVHERKWYFNWFIAMYIEQYFLYYIFQGKYSTLCALWKIKHSSALSSCMASYNNERDWCC